MSTAASTLKGKVAVVTGGGTGLGKAIILRLADEGCDVVVAARRVGAIEQTASEVRDVGPRALAIRCDVTDSTQCDNLIARTLSEFGRLDILVNNAGIVRDEQRKPLWEITDEEWHLGIDTNLSGTFYCCRRVLKRFVEQNSGKIINIASASGLRGYRSSYMYATAKAAVINLTRIMAMTFSTYNIQINCIAPGAIDVRHMQPEPATGESGWTSGFIPVGRIGVPNDIGHLGLFLASDASASITGGLFICDGGSLAGSVAPTGYAPVIEMKEDQDGLSRLQS